MNKLEKLFELCNKDDKFLVLFRSNPQDVMAQSDKRYFLHVRTSFKWPDEKNCNESVYKAYGNDPEELAGEAYAEVEEFLKLSKEKRGDAR